MPEHHRGLQFFQSKAEELAAEHFGEDNIIELAFEALQSERNNPVDHIVNIPEFRIDSNIEATELLRKVNISIYLKSSVCLDVLVSFEMIFGFRLIVLSSLLFYFSCTLMHHLMMENLIGLSRMNPSK